MGVNNYIIGLGAVVGCAGLISSSYNSVTGFETTVPEREKMIRLESAVKSLDVVLDDYFRIETHGSYTAIRSVRDRLKNDAENLESDPKVVEIEARRGDYFLNSSKSALVGYLGILMAAAGKAHKITRPKKDKK